MSFSTATKVKAVRKARACVACPVKVAVGEPAVVWAGMTDGYFSRCTYHPECRAAEIALNRMQGGNWDEWWPLSEIERDDHEWLLEEHPVVAARFKITPDTIKRDREEAERCRRAWARPASVDTHPKDGDAVAAPLVSGAVPEGQTPETQP